MMEHCVACRKKLVGRQRKYCSRQCKNNILNQSHQSYLCQQKRGRDRKLLLIEDMGKQCGRCGYNQNYAALEFHHKEPAKKSFQLDLRALSNRKWERILEEAKKCELLCANCHAEEHNPNCAL
jgi:hypothetical protein